MNVVKINESIHPSMNLATESASKVAEEIKQ
jgi:hypothetical protein